MLLLAKDFLDECFGIICIKSDLFSLTARGGRGGAPAGDISSDDSSSDSDQNTGRQAPQAQLSAKTKAIALAWLRNCRGRR